jgi:hypothetical protein
VVGDHVKKMAAELGTPYQDLIKLFLTRISHVWPNDVAPAPLRAVRRLFPAPPQACGQAVEGGRRRECRRGTQECVRHALTTEVCEKCGLRDCGIRKRPRTMEWTRMRRRSQRGS